MVAEATTTTHPAAASAVPAAPWVQIPALDVVPPAALPSAVPGMAEAAHDELFRGLYLRAGAVAPGVLAIASACRGEGKTTVALGLARAIARDFPTRRVAYVETDLQQPAIAARIGVNPNPGLLDYLVRGQSIDGAAYRPTALENLRILPAGGPDLNPTRWYASRDVGERIAEVRREHDVVLLDVPALAVSSGALLLLEAADRVLFVVRSGATPAPLARATLAQVPDDKLRGVVLNGARSAVPGWVRRLIGLA